MEIDFSICWCFLWFVDGIYIDIDSWYVGIFWNIVKDSIRTPLMPRDPTPDQISLRWFPQAMPLFLSHQDLQDVNFITAMKIKWVNTQGYTGMKIWV